MSIKESLNLDNIPQHVAVIMDGNGRWARQQGEIRTFGHHHGVSSVRDVVEACREIGVKFLTIYAFSTENWNRPEIEINTLMEILVGSLKNETPMLNENEIKIEYLHFKHPKYPQNGKSFISQMGIVDSIANIGYQNLLDLIKSSTLQSTKTPKL